MAHLPHVEVRVGDASAPDLPEAAYDVVACCLVLFFLPDPLSAVRAWLPAVAPGGRVGVTTFGEQDPRWKVVDGVFAPYLPKAMLDARTSGTRGPFGSDAGMEALLREAGLVDVRTVRREVVTGARRPRALDPLQLVARAARHVGGGAGVRPCSRTGRDRRPAGSAGPPGPAHPGGAAHPRPPTLGTPTAGPSTGTGRAGRG